MISIIDKPMKQFLFILFLLPLSVFGQVKPSTNTLIGDDLQLNMPDTSTSMNRAVGYDTARKVITVSNNYMISDRFMRNYVANYVSTTSVLKQDSGKTYITPLGLSAMIDAFQTFNDGRYKSINYTAPVSSVNGQTGAVNIAIPSAIPYDSLQYYASTGRYKQKIKVWTAIVTPTTAQGFNVDISSAGFNTITNIQMQPANNTNTAVTVPIVSLKSYTNTQVSMNIVVSNNSLLGSLLNAVVGLIFPTNLTGITVHLRVEGY